MVDRRTLLTRIVVGFSAVAGIGISIPYIRSLFPGSAAGVQTLDVDVATMRAGETVKVNWLGRPVLIHRRTSEEIAAVIEADPSTLTDPDSGYSSQPDFASNAKRSRREDHFVAYANCTHLGCEVKTHEKGGFDCPCHQSRFDAAGRVLRGGAARINLEVPEYRYAGADVIRLVSKRG